LKSFLWEEWDSLDLDQRKGIPPPPFQKPYYDESTLIDLIPPDKLTIGRVPVFEIIKTRQSHRAYTGESISIEELSYLLWATQGINRVIQGGQTVIRTVPSAGARHPFETYIFLNNVTNIPTGLYRYLGIEHQLLLLNKGENLISEVHQGTYEQYVMESAVVFIWSAIPYRAEWRYGPLAHKMIAQDSGHLCQNLYIACGSIGLGACAIGAYNQKKMDDLLGLDGTDEFTIYAATVGKIK
jgi:SagB-type dehydrogenase family enzyme